MAGGIRCTYQGIENAGLFIKKGTDDVPDDGKYHLVQSGKVVFTHSNLKTIQKRYSEILSTIEYEKPKTDFTASSKEKLIGDIYSSMPLERKPFTHKRR